METDDLTEEQIDAMCQPIDAMSKMMIKIIKLDKEHEFANVSSSYLTTYHKTASLKNDVNQLQSAQCVYMTKNPIVIYRPKLVPPTYLANPSKNFHDEPNLCSLEALAWWIQNGPPCDEEIIDKILAQNIQVVQHYFEIGWDSVRTIVNPTSQIKPRKRVPVTVPKYKINKDRFTAMMLNLMGKMYVGRTEVLSQYEKEILEKLKDDLPLEKAPLDSIISIARDLLVPRYRWVQSDNAYDATRMQYVTALEQGRISFEVQISSLQPDQEDTNIENIARMIHYVAFNKDTMVEILVSATLDNVLISDLLPEESVRSSTKVLLASQGRSINCGTELFGTVCWPFSSGEVVKEPLEIGCVGSLNVRVPGYRWVGDEEIHFQRGAIWGKCLKTADGISKILVNSNKSEPDEIIKAVCSVLVYCRDGAGFKNLIDGKIDHLNWRELCYKQNLREWDTHLKGKVAGNTLARTGWSKQGNTIVKEDKILAVQSPRNTTEYNLTEDLELKINDALISVRPCFTGTAPEGFFCVSPGFEQFYTNKKLLFLFSKRIMDNPNLIENIRDGIFLYPGSEELRKRINEDHLFKVARTCRTQLKMLLRLLEQSGANADMGLMIYYYIFTPFSGCDLDDRENPVGEVLFNTGEKVSLEKCSGNASSLMQIYKTTNSLGENVLQLKIGGKVVVEDGRTILKMKNYWKQSKKLTTTRGYCIGIEDAERDGHRECAVRTTYGWYLYKRSDTTTDLLIDVSENILKFGFSNKMVN